MQAMTCSSRTGLPAHVPRPPVHAAAQLAPALLAAPPRLYARPATCLPLCRAAHRPIDPPACTTGRIPAHAPARLPVLPSTARSHSRMHMPHTYPPTSQPQHCAGQRPSCPPRLHTAASLPARSPARACVLTAALRTHHLVHPPMSALRSHLPACPRPCRCCMHMAQVFCWCP